MTVEFVTIAPDGHGFSIEPVKNHPLPPMTGKTPQAVAEKLVKHFEEAVRTGQGWITPKTVLVVEMPDGQTTEISSGNLPSLNS